MTIIFDMAMVDQYLARRLRQRRMSRGLTQKQLALKVGVTVQQIHKYEKGIDRLSASRLLLLAQILQVPITFFYEDFLLSLKRSKYVVLTFHTGKHLTLHFSDEEGLISDMSIKEE